MENTKVHIIMGDADTGKTTTAWLVYLLLKEIGEVEFFHAFHDGNFAVPCTSDEPVHDILTYNGADGSVNVYDFCAVIMIANKRINIFSAGDTYKAINHAFEWVALTRPDFFIGCSRKHGNTAARCELNKHEAGYDMTFYHVGYDYTEKNLENARQSRKHLAEEIMSSLIPNYRLLDIEKLLNQLLGKLDEIKPEDVPYEMTIVDEAGLKISEVQEQRVFDKLDAINTLMKVLRPRLLKEIL